MAYEELVIPAIQFKHLSGFSSRFRTFSSKEERDRTLAFVKENDHVAARTTEAVTLKIVVQTDEVNQMTLLLE